VIFLPGNDRYLSLKMRNELFKGPFGAQIYSTESWTLFKNSDSQYTFLSSDTEPHYLVIVNSEFTNGEIIGDFNQLTGKSVYPLETIEIRIYSTWLATLGDLILHSSGIAIDGKGYCFIGESGAGKSTLAAALAADPAVTVLGEDQVILRYLDEQFWIFGTPWHTNPAMCSPLGVPLEKLYFLDRFASPGVQSVKPAQGVANLLQTAFVPYYLHENIPGILDRLSLLAERIPFYKLSYRLGTDPLPLIL